MAPRWPAASSDDDEEAVAAAARCGPKEEEEEEELAQGLISDTALAARPKVSRNNLLLATLGIAAALLVSFVAFHIRSGRAHPEESAASGTVIDAFGMPAASTASVATAPQGQFAASAQAAGTSSAVAQPMASSAYGVTPQQAAPAASAAAAAPQQHSMSVSSSAYGVGAVAAATPAPQPPAFVPSPYGMVAVSPTAATHLPAPTPAAKMFGQVSTSAPAPPKYMNPLAPQPAPAAFHTAAAQPVGIAAAVQPAAATAQPVAIAAAQPVATAAAQPAAAAAQPAAAAAAQSLAAAGAVTAAAEVMKPPPPQPAPVGPWVAAVAKAKRVLSNLTQDQKLSLIQGDTKNRRGYAGWIGFDGHQLSFNDGPQGYNTYNSHPGTSTQFPSLLSVAASFDPAVATQYAAAVADEFNGKGANVLLGPDVEIMRARLAGRGFETISGEDPYLGSQLVGPFVQAVQSKGVMACVKHWLDNNEEIFRMTMSVSVDDRTQHEIYMPVFKAAIDAGAAAVMCSYNKVYGVHSCENPRLLGKLLRHDLNFHGLIISDWGATHDAVKSMKAGLDIDMQQPGNGKELLDEYYKLPGLLKAGKVTQAEIDEKALHVLSAMYALKLTPTGWGAKPDDISSDAHRAVALKTITESTVLLKNEANTLPIATAGKKIVMVGKYCKCGKDKKFKQGNAYSGGGSGYVDTDTTISPLEGVKAAITDAQVSYGPDASAAAGADFAVVCVSAHAEEGWDRKDLKVPQAQELVTAAKAVAKKVVVLAMVPGPVETDWVEGADAVLLLFMPGEQVGPAVAKLLTGAASPNGRLPVSMPKAGEKRFTKEQYPGTPFNDVKMVAQFTDGVLVGYRWNDAMGVPSAYAFGFGLAYTQFQLKGITARCAGATATVSMQVVNLGSREGVAVPQVYVGFKSLAPAIRQLRGFKKVIVPASGQTTVSFTLTAADWSYYCQTSQAWVDAAAKGEQITVSVGTSSADLPFTQALMCSR